MAERGADERGREQITCKYNSNAWSLQREPGLVERGNKGAECIRSWTFYVTRAPLRNIWQHLIFDIRQQIASRTTFIFVFLTWVMLVGHSQTIKIVFSNWRDSISTSHLPNLLLKQVHMHLGVSTRLACSVHYVLSQPRRAYSTWWVLSLWEGSRHGAPHKCFLGWQNESQGSLVSDAAPIKWCI